MEKNYESRIENYAVTRTCRMGTRNTAKMAFQFGGRGNIITCA
jgi:hypothetical protein